MEVYRPATYSKEQIFNIRVAYAVATIVWIVILLIFDILPGALRSKDWMGCLILSLPIFFFASNFANVHKVTKDVEDDMFKSDYLSVGLIIILPLVTWLSKNSTVEQKSRFLKIVMLGIILSLVSKFDLWVSVRDNAIVKHIKSAMMTAALTLVVYGLYVFYLHAY